MNIHAAQARKIYVLTENGQIRGATYSFHRAEQWLALGNANDYIPIIPEEYVEAPPQPESAKEQPAAAMARTDEVLKEHGRVQERLDRLRDRLKSPLLQTPKD